VLTDALPFPSTFPSSYEILRDEPVFNPRRHLALEPPSQVLTLYDFGYSEKEAQKCASQVAITGPFRLLSMEGAEAARSVALALKSSGRTSARTASYLAGGVYRSRFMRELCNSPDIAAFFSEIAGCELVPHSMPSQQLYINYAPDDVNKAVDTWHTDSIGFDTVVLASDPADFCGGEFEFFHGTTQEAAVLLDTHPDRLTGAIAQDLPKERVTSLRFPSAGYAVFQQGTMVTHRATRLERRGERNTMVIGYVSRDIARPDPTLDSIVGWGEPGIIAEFVRHKAWLSRAKLDDLLRRIDVNELPTDILSNLADAIGDTQHAIAVIDRSIQNDA
jgi:hypothetical protein